jgi:cytochrome c oxidase accessory protein FixG
MSNIEDDSFRDSIGTINEKGKRKFIFPKKPQGKYYDRRKLVSYALLAFLLSSPFIKINGNQFLLFNVLDRRFNIFGMPFWPQDFYLVVILMITGVVGLTLFTVAFGRIFCGWFCPQTIFMEMVFRRIEYWIDGDRGAQIKLESQEWNAEKIIKRVLKWFVFLIISFGIANVFLAYLVGSDTLEDMIVEGPLSNIKTLIVLCIFTGIFYFVFTWFREQVCIIACPYGRLQGVLLDNKSLVVAYDYVRGENENGRAKFKKNEDRVVQKIGDCIDCHQCVNVCPTGIDIRHGTQLECTNCTACMDECDLMMEKVNLPKGLIRYASEVEISKKETFKLTTRMKGYIAVLVILTTVMISMILLRTEVDTKILRLSGQLYEEKGKNISNVYTYRIINKTNDNLKNITFKLIHPKQGTLKLVGNSILHVEKADAATGTLFVEIPLVILESDNTKINIEVHQGNKLIETITTNFLGPRTFN